MKRWVINFGLFAIRLHKWIASDDDRHLHDHPWDFIVLVLRGWYADVTDTGWHPVHVEILSAGKVVFRKAEHKHFVNVGAGGPVWTLLLTGPKKRNWGFWVNGKFKKANKYFFEFKKHPCKDLP